MKASLAIRLALSLAFAGAAVAAHAQYIWLDEHGVKQFSDQPPPSSVPQKNILKEPGRMARSMSESDSDESAASDNAQPAPKTVDDLNAEYIKRQKAKAEADKKAAAQEKQEQEKAKNCARTREYQRTLEAGRKISTTDENGERNTMSEEERTRDMEENRQILQDCP